MRGLLILMLIFILKTAVQNAGKNNTQKNGKNTDVFTKKFLQKMEPKPTEEKPVLDNKVHKKRKDILSKINEERTNYKSEKADVYNEVKEFSYEPEEELQIEKLQPVTKETREGELIGNFQGSDLIKGIILAEILDRPISMRK